MKVEVITPEDYMGDVMGDLNRRRGIVQGMDETPSASKLELKCHCLRCLVMPQTYVQPLRDAQRIRWSSPNTLKRLRLLQRQ